MPYKSKSQMRAFFAKEESGELPEGTAERWAKHTPDISKLPEKKKKKEKDAFVHGFVTTFLAKLGMTEESFSKTALARAIVKTAETPGDPVLAGQAADAKNYAELGKNRLLMHVGSPFIAGALGGAGLAKLLGPADIEVGNLQKQELLTHYDSAIQELERRIASRRG